MKEKKNLHGSRGEEALWLAAKTIVLGPNKTAATARHCRRRTSSRWIHFGAYSPSLAVLEQAVLVGGAAARQIHHVVLLAYRPCRAVCRPYLAHQSHENKKQRTKEGVREKKKVNLGWYHPIRNYEFFKSMLRSSE